MSSRSTKTWSKVRHTIGAGSALRDGAQHRGLQRDRQDKPPAADPRPTPSTSLYGPHTGGPHHESSTGGYAPEQQWQTHSQQSTYPYSDRGTHTNSHEYDHSNQQTSPPRQHGYQGMDGQAQNLPNQYDYSQHNHSNPGSHTMNQYYPGQPCQAPYSHTATNPGAYHRDELSYSSNGQAYPPQFSSSNERPLVRATTEPYHNPLQYGFQEPDGQAQNLPNPYHHSQYDNANPGPHRQNLDYSGQPHQGPYSQTDTNRETYHQDGPGYFVNGQAYPPQFLRATTEPIKFPQGPSNSNYDDGYDYDYP